VEIFGMMLLTAIPKQLFSEMFHSRTYKRKL